MGVSFWFMLLTPFFPFSLPFLPRLLSLGLDALFSYGSKLASYLIECASVLKVLQTKFVNWLLIPFIRQMTTTHRLINCLRIRARGGHIPQPLRKKLVSEPKAAVP